MVRIKYRKTITAMLWFFLLDMFMRFKSLMYTHKRIRAVAGENYWHKLLSAFVFSKNCDNNFFRSVGKGVAIKMKNYLFYYRTNKNIIVITNVTGKIKQRKMRF